MTPRCWKVQTAGRATPPRWCPASPPTCRRPVSRWPHDASVGPDNGATVGSVVRGSTTVAALLTALTVLAALTGCAPQQSAQRATAPGAADYAVRLREQVTTGAMLAHLARLQHIADANGGNRAVGTPGYDASVDYVVNTLKGRGFDVQTPEFEFRQFHADPPALTVNGATIDSHALEYSIGTPPQGASGPLLASPVAAPVGCDAADYDRVPVTGAVALVDRGACPFATKEAAAAQSGAIALIVADNVDEEKMDGTLGEQTQVRIPVISVSKADGVRLRARPGPTTIKLNAGVTPISARNIIAQTRTGSARNVVMAGAHLDSVAAGPGINDNGSGVAAVLETAVQMGSSPPVRNAVRFGFWGAEELGLVGSNKYVESLDVDGLKDIALYLNFDMLGSPNPGYFTYDGDQSAPPNPDRSAPRVPQGTAGIERTLMAYLTSTGHQAEDMSFDGRSDYLGFTSAGIPAGGLFSGAEGNKTTDQAQLWGGEADRPFDPNYHQKADTLDNINRTALGINGEGVAYSVGLYSQDIGGRNGVPIRDGRTRHPLANS
ncbi:MAG: M28 family peptidase [Mycobacteriaceae bacterium]|nr:M28 family peptidase [Mycobacteriaceae bacterium]